MMLLQYSTVQYSTATVQSIYSNMTADDAATVQYSTVQYSTATVQSIYSSMTVDDTATVQYSTVQYSTATVQSIYSNMTADDAAAAAVLAGCRALSSSCQHHYRRKQPSHTFTL